MSFLLNSYIFAGAGASASVGSASGAGASSGAGAAFWAALGDAAGSGAATGYGSAVFEADGSASGAGALDAVAGFGAEGTAAGAGGAVADGSSTAEASGTAAGTSSVAAVGAAIAEALAAASGSGQATGVRPIPIEFVGATITGRTGINVGTYPIQLDSGLTGGSRSSVQQGDLVIAVHAIGINGSFNPTIRDPSSNNYTQIHYENTAGLYDVVLKVAYKFMGSTPDTQTVFGNSGNSQFPFSYAVYVFSGVDQTTPLDVTVTTSSSAATAIPDPPSITPVTGGAYIVAVAAAGHVAGTITFTNSDLTDFVTNGQNDSYDVTLGIGHKPDWTSGAFDPAAWTFGAADTTNYSNVAVTIALRPANPG